VYRETSELNVIFEVVLPRLQLVDGIPVDIRTNRDRTVHTGGDVAVLGPRDVCQCHSTEAGDRIGVGFDNPSGRFRALPCHAMDIVIGVRYLCSIFVFDLRSNCSRTGQIS
jgi:hypothetical protein